jgi:hypothetical protein
MCWSGEASFTLATVGFAGAYLSARYKHPTARWLPLAYFSCMEALQGFTYMWIGKCGNDYNTVLTILSYIHIAFQPFFINMFALSFKPQAWKHWGMIASACTLSTMVMLSMLMFPGFPANCSPPDQTICGAVTCSYHGNWHIAWMLQLSNLDPHYFSYIFVAFVVPLFYGAWRVVLYHALFGPLLMFLLSSNKDEQPAIWCLLSIGILLATHIPAISNWLGDSKKEQEHVSV